MPGAPEVTQLHSQTSQATRMDVIRELVEVFANQINQITAPEAPWTATMAGPLVEGYFSVVVFLEQLQIS